MSEKKHNRSKTLIKPTMWNAWQRIAYRLQTPPLTQQEFNKLNEYANLIGYNNIYATPVMICVELSKHFDQH